MRKKTLLRRFAAAAAAAVFIFTAVVSAESGEKNMKSTDFVTHTVDIDGLLARNFDEGVILGYNEDIFSLYQPGWGFDAKSVYRTGEEVSWNMPVTVMVNGADVRRGDASFVPSHITETADATVRVNRTSLLNGRSVSFDQTAYGCGLDFAFDGDCTDAQDSYWNRNWNTWSDPMRAGDEWLELRFGELTDISGIDIYFYSEGAAGNVTTPTAAKVQYSDSGEWKDIAGASISSPREGLNTITFARLSSDAFRIVITPCEGKAIGVYEVALFDSAAAELPVQLEGYKYISPDGYAAVIINAENLSDMPAELTVSASSSAADICGDGILTGSISGFDITVSGDGFTAADGILTRSVTLNPGEKQSFRVAMSYGSSVEGFFSDPDPIATQKTRFNEWFTENIPYIDVPDEVLRQVYYFRWYTFRNNIRMTPDGHYVITEFVPNVGWSGVYNTINCPAGFHINEARWLRDGVYLNDCLDFWTGDEAKMGVDGGFSFWAASAYYGSYLAVGDAGVLAHLDSLKENYLNWEAQRLNTENGLYWQHCGADGMENSVVLGYWGAGYRPTINSYQYGDALAIAEMCRLTGDSDGAALFTAKAEAIRTATEELLWDAEASFYKQIPTEGDAVLSLPREEIGFVPWMFGLPADTAERGNAWLTSNDPDVFFAAYGPRTVEKTYARTPEEAEYGSGGCRWDGPSWPFATSQTLIAMSNLLNDYAAQTAVDGADYYEILSAYAASHYKNGSLWLAENLDADSGRWLADCERSPNYNHSEFADLLITGLFGVRPAEGDSLTVNPQIPSEWDYFCLENLPYHGKCLTLLYDRDGSRYDQGRGFKIFVDGVCIVSEDGVGKTVFSLDDLPPEPDTSSPITFYAILAAIAVAIAAVTAVIIKSKKAPRTNREAKSDGI